MKTCPVCGGPVDPITAPTSTYHGVTYRLRCRHCQERFDADPERYLTGPDAHCAEHDAPGGEPGHDGRR